MKLKDKQLAEYFLLPARSVLNPCTSPRLPFRWTINPYRGCEFGCKYCYARYTHEFMGLDDPLDFEEKIYSKQDAGEILRRELTRDPSGEIAVGTATDPYQPAERLYGTTRAILETLNEFRGLRVSITTKSDLVMRDIPLLREFAGENHLRIHLTITTLREDLARLLEPRAPRPELRLKAVRALVDAGIHVSVFAMPVLPGITDGHGELEMLAERAAAAGASYLAVNVLFLQPSAKAAFLPFLKEHFPHLMLRYEKLYSSGPYLRGDYERQLQERVAALRTKHGLNSPSPGPHLPPFGIRSQLQLFSC
ncbi:MAG: radical SAM protein [Acidobacteria bacterium]|nr:radical SAM protein [Acidobacteriota bacterium]